MHEVELSVGVGLQVIVQAVAAQQLEQRLRLQALLRQIGQIDARRVALVLDVEAELLFLDVSGQVVDVLHHQVPVALRGVVRRVLQRLHEEALLGVGKVAGELTYLESATAEGVLEGDGQHLVGLQAGLQRDIAHGLVDGVLRRRQQSGRGQFLEVGAAMQEADFLKGRADVVDAALHGVHSAVEGRILTVGQVAGHALARRCPVGVRHPFILTQVGEGHDVSRVVGVRGVIGDPHFDAVDLDAGHQVGRRRHGIVINLTEVLCQEEVAVLLVVGHVYLEGGGLCAAATGDAFRGGLLLRHHRIQLQFAELHGGIDAEEARSAFHQRVVGGEADVARLQLLDNLVLLAVVLQLQVLCVEVEGGIGVVVEVEVHLVAHLRIGRDVDFLVEVEARGLTVTDGQRGVVDVLQRGS